MNEGFAEQPANFRVLALDGGGAKGFCTLGVLREIEGLVKQPLHNAFDLVFGISTGAIIAFPIVFGYPIDDIHALYKTPLSRTG